MSEARVSPGGPVAMVTLRGDLGAEALDAAVHEATGCAVPDVRRMAFDGDRAVAWMSPDELMLFLPDGRGPETVAAIAAALAGRHHLVADVSDARSLFRIEGSGARAVLAKGAPVDLAPDAFGPGDFRRTRLGQVAVAFWCRDPGTFELMCFRSVAGFVDDWLRNAAAPGSLPGLLTAG